MQIPQDPARWQELQKSLVQGGVYHVQQSGANRETMYCLWNGTQLVPCEYLCHVLSGEWNCNINHWSSGPNPVISAYAAGPLKSLNLVQVNSAWSSQFYPLVDQHSSIHLNPTYNNEV